MRKIYVDKKSKKFKASLGGMLDIRMCNANESPILLMLVEHETDTFCLVNIKTGYNFNTIAYDKAILEKSSSLSELLKELNLKGFNSVTYLASNDFDMTLTER